MKKFLAVLSCAALFIGCNSTDKTEATGTNATTTTNAEYEIGDTANIATVLKAYDAFSAGNVDGFVADYADNCFYRFNNGDSLVGKAAITDYWRMRRTEVIDTVSFRDHITLPMKVNTPQAPGQRTGNYILNWHIVTAKYMTGKSIEQRMHAVYHFDANGKIDYVSHYMDRAQIIAAATK